MLLHKGRPTHGNEKTVSTASSGITLRSSARGPFRRSSGGILFWVGVTSHHLCANLHHVKHTRVWLIRFGLARLIWCTMGKPGILLIRGRFFGSRPCWWGIPSILLVRTILSCSVM